ncbi:MAG: NAD(P)-dependent oxidoreductase [Acidobacteria bacterium]|nr:NAD(P)-dependent oxidoreductase [Acidobacteriota bacterium]
MSGTDRNHLDTATIEENFAEINPAMTFAEAAAEAHRCLYCYDAPCMQACPTHIDVPTFIRKIATENLKGSARVIFEANPIGATCARVCPVEVLCEGACVEKTLLQRPIEIGRLQRHATDHVFKNNISVLKRGEPNGLSVGIIGSGPAGLSGAAYLAQLGYDVTIYERKEMAGGLNTYAMAEYKIRQQTSLEEVKLVEDLGVNISVNTEIIKPGAEHDEAKEGIVFGKLLQDHNAVLIAVGLGKTNRLNIPGESLNGVSDALAFIEQIKTREWNTISVGKNVAVIGAGNTAIDAATQAKRLGAEKVTLVYRRTEKEAPAYDYEMEIARLDGVEFIWQAAPAEIIGNGSVNSLKCVKTDGSGDIFEIDCDQVIKAIGQSRMTEFFTETCGVSTDEYGRVVVDEKMMTSRPDVFAAGDCVNGGADAVDAAQLGKKAAAGIHNLLAGDHVDLPGLY